MPRRLPGASKPRRRWWLPISLAVSATIAVVLTAVLGPAVHRAWHVAGLGSDNPQRREAALNWVIRATAEDENAWSAVVEALPTLPAEHAGQAYMAMRRAGVGRSFDVDHGLMAAYAEADHDAFVSLIRVVQQDDGEAAFVIIHAASERLIGADDEQFADLMTILDRQGSWTVQNVPLQAWVRWIAKRAVSNDATIRQDAMLRLADAAAKQPWTRARTDAAREEAGVIDTVDRILTSAAGDENGRVRRAAWLAAGGWSERSKVAATLFQRPGDKADAELLRWVGAANEPAHRFEFVADPTESEPAFPGTARGDDLRLLWRIEHTPPMTATPASLGVDAPESLPPLQIALLARAAVEPSADWLRPDLNHEDPHLRALAAIVAVQYLEAKPLAAILLDELNDLDPIGQQSGLLLVSLTDGYSSLRTLLLPERALDRIYAISTSSDVGNRRLASLFTASMGEPESVAAGMLASDNLPRPVVLTALLERRLTVAYDYLLGPFGVDDPSLIDLLDHHRFAWVLDALMPEDAPRFPLWVDREMQLEAIAHLRVWYARHRATWTQG